MNENLRPDPRLERHLLGETPQHLAESTQKALGEAGAQARLRALQESNEAILSTLPPDRMAEAIRRRSAGSPSKQRGWIGGLAMAGLALGLSVGVFRIMGHSPEAPLAKAPLLTDSSRTSTVQASVGDSQGVSGIRSNPHRDSASGPRIARTSDSARGSDTSSWEVAWAEDDILLKGKTHRLAIHRIARNNAEAVRLSDRDSAGTNDLLQVGTLAGPKRFVAILSLDGSGQVTRHLPETGDSSVPVSSKLQAPHSYQLDDAPRFERFVLVESRTAFDLASVEALLKQAGGTGSLVRKGLRFESIYLSKSP